MKRPGFVKFLVITATIFIFFTTTIKAENFAVLVGVGEYLTENNDLAFPPNDVEAIRDVLLHIGYKPENVFCLTSNKAGRLATQPLKSNIIVTINTVLSKAKPDDTVIIILVGHGLEIEGEARFCPADMRGGSLDIYRATTVSIDDIISDFGICKAKHKVMFIEACRDEKALPEGVLPMPPLPSPPKGALLLQSCSSGQTSVGVKTDTFSHGVFSFALLEGLCGAATNRAGDITQLSLCTYVMERAEELAKELADHQQTPFMLGNTDTFIMVPKDKINQQKKLEELLAEYRKVRERSEAARAEAIAKALRQLADSREYVEKEIREKIRVELEEGDKNDGMLEDKIRTSIKSMIANKAALKAHYDLLKGICSSEKEVYEMEVLLIDVPLKKAYNEALIAFGKIRKEQIDAVEKERVANQKAIQAEMENLISGDLLAKLKSRDKEQRYAAIEELKEKEITAQLTGGLYVFSYRGIKMDSDNSAKLQDAGKYLVEPESALHPRLIDLDIHNKVSALDKNVVTMLPNFGAKVIIHGMLFGGDPENKDCPFVSRDGNVVGKNKDFEELCEYLKKNVDKLGLKPVKYDNHESDIYTAAEIVAHAGGGGDPFCSETHFRYTTISMTDETRIAMGNGFIFDTIKENNGEYYYSKTDHKGGNTGVALAKHRRAILTSNKNEYLKHKQVFRN